jgi:GNAT superfamily N-acetyltransferase
MPDMLVKLYDIDWDEDPSASLAASGMAIRRALAPEKSIVVEWVRARFGQGWASECDVAFANSPVSCYIAVEGGSLLGFACYEATCKDFFGPTGVAESARGRGIGKALLFRCLASLREMGYAYAIIGGAGPIDFYRGCVGAAPIEGSAPGIYGGMLEEGAARS